MNHDQSRGSRTFHVRRLVRFWTIVGWPDAEVERCSPPTVKVVLSAPSQGAALRAFRDRPTGPDGRCAVGVARVWPGIHPEALAERLWSRWAGRRTLRTSGRGTRTV